LVEAQLSEFTRFTRDASSLLETVDDLAIEIVDFAGKPVIPDQVFAWYTARTLPMPTKDHIIRVAGDVGPEGFLFGGATWHYRLSFLAKRVMGREISRQDRVLDWGIGCGRVARHFFEREFWNVTGADIDGVNVNWLNESVGKSVARRIDFDPPMPYPDDYFDIVYGHSVFTHLRFDDQFKWLAELQRVIAPGGFAFVTVCSEPGVLVSRFSDYRTFWDKYQADGFYDWGAQPVGVDEGREGYYRLSFHTQRFIEERWSPYFVIESILPCYMEHQTLLILRKRTGFERHQ
jgi:SAM-dependent methyltransferase